MTASLPLFAPANRPPEPSVARPSLAVAMPTTMVFVDYALADLPTPTMEQQTLATELPEDLATASRPIRAALAHGTQLRAVLLAQLPDDHAGHRDWPALRSWLHDLDDDRILGLVESGVRSVLAFGGPPSVQTTPDHEIAGLLGTLEELRRDAVRVLGMWSVPEPESRVAELLDAGGVRTTLLALLDQIWERWLGPLWTEQLPALEAAAANAPNPPTGCGGAQWLNLVTGLLPDPQYAKAADHAARLVVMPCPGLDLSLSMFDVADVTYALYTPQGARADDDIEATDGDQPEGVDLTAERLTQLTPAMQALGDPTRLAIVLRLIERGPLMMQQLTDALRVHQTTISRQVAALRKAGIVSQDDRRRIVVSRDEIRQACKTLLDALG